MNSNFNFVRVISIITETKVSWKDASHSSQGIKKFAWACEWGPETATS